MTLFEISLLLILWTAGSVWLFTDGWYSIAHYWGKESFWRCHLIRVVRMFWALVWFASTIFLAWCAF